MYTLKNVMKYINDNLEKVSEIDKDTLYKLVREELSNRIQNRMLCKYMADFV